MRTLKNVILLCALGLFPIAGNSQQILNGGFEETYFDSSSTFPPGYLRPLNWSIHEILDLFWACNHVTGEMTNDSHSGEWAVKLETVVCGPLYGGSISTTMEVPNSMFFPEGMSHVLEARPDQLSFYFKYDPVGGDTARVEALLFNYPDSITMWSPEWFSSIDTIGIAKELIIETVEEYSEHVVNFEYFSDEVPQYISVFFATNHNLGGMLEPSVAHAGTTLCIDDVALIYLNTSSEDHLSSTDIRIFPNPVADHFQIDAPDKTQLQSIVVFDSFGRIVQTLNPQDRLHPLNNLSPGIYFVRIETEKGSVVKKVVKE